MTSDTHRNPGNRAPSLFDRAARLPSAAGSASNPLTIVNLSELAPQWNWVSAAFRDTGQTWRHVSTQSFNLPAWLPRHTTLARLHAARQAVKCLGYGPSVLVTHGPRPAMYGALMAGRQIHHHRHLAFSFNYTELPAGMARRLMARAFRSIERFVVFSELERGIYADHFDLPLERFDMLHWGAQPPCIDPDAPPLERGDYLCALGSQGRDYKTLLLAMRRLPRLRLVIVAAPENLVNLEIPANVSVKMNLPLGQAMNILAHSRFMVLPLRGARVPCGHVTMVSAMHSGKAVIATDSAGLNDYIVPQVTALTCPAQNAAAMSAAIMAMHDDPAMSLRLGLAGQRFARKHCTEESIIEYMRRFLQVNRGRGS